MRCHSHIPISLASNIIYLIVGIFYVCFNGKRFDVFLQEFGHHVRLATHANFSDFVKSAGVDFYPLGGDPRVLAGCKSSLILKNTFSINIAIYLSFGGDLVSRSFPMFL